ncbi:hypothetical protein L1887_22706 [Cichorium endivia]|nr:hypothetical protein L1887_22706 [Cichorium endivia]
MEARNSKIWTVCIDNLKYKVSFEQFLGLVLRNQNITNETLISDGEKDTYGRLVFNPLKHESNKHLFTEMLKVLRKIDSTHGLENRKSVEKYVSLVEDKHGLLVPQDFEDDVLHLHVSGNSDEHFGSTLVPQPEKKDAKVKGELDLKEKCLVKVLFVAKTSKETNSEVDFSAVSSDVFEGMKPYRKPTLVENRNYQLRSPHDPKASDPKTSVPTQKDEQSSCFRSHVHKFKKKKKKKKRSKTKMIWVPKEKNVGVPSKSEVKKAEKCVVIKRKLPEVWFQRRNFLMNSGWYNERYEDFLVPTKRSRKSDGVSLILVNGFDKKFGSNAMKMVWVAKGSRS